MITVDIANGIVGIVNDNCTDEMNIAIDSCV